MTEWTPEVVQVGEVFPHPNKDNPDPAMKCDTLSYTEVFGGYPVLFRTGEFKTGDIAAYIPVDTVVPEDHPMFAFLGNHRRIKAKRLRGMFSMGMLVACPQEPAMKVGDSVKDYFGLVKYEPSEEGFKSSRGMAVAGPTGWEFPKYTDIEALRRNKNVLVVGEEVVILEKVHGSNARYCWDDKEEKLWVGSHNVIKKRDGEVNWWHIANKLGLEEKLSKFPGTIFFGEIYGKSIQNLTYGLTTKEFRVFDTFDTKKNAYNDWDKTVALTAEAGLELVPVLYRGPWLGVDRHIEMAEGQSMIASHVREGFVVKPVIDRWEHRCGRVILKHIGEGYMLRDEKKSNKSQ